MTHLLPCVITYIVAQLLHDMSKQTSTQSSNSHIPPVGDKSRKYNNKSFSCRTTSWNEMRNCYGFYATYNQYFSTHLYDIYKDSKYLTAHCCDDWILFYRILLFVGQLFNRSYAILIVFFSLLFLYQKLIDMRNWFHKYILYIIPYQ